MTQGNNGRRSSSKLKVATVFESRQNISVSYLCPVPSPYPLSDQHVYIQKTKKTNVWTITAEQQLADQPGRPGPATKLPCRAALITLHNKSKHALQLICITFYYNISAGPRPTHIAHLGRARRRACSLAPRMHHAALILQRAGRKPRTCTLLQNDAVFCSAAWLIV